MKTGDLFIFTTLNSTGIDLQALWEDSNTFSPPHHLNFLNPWALEGLLTKMGFVDVEITTPGKLDVDILSNNQDLISDRFLKVFFKYCDQDAKTQLQSLLVKSKFSSHMMIVCEKG